MKDGDPIWFRALLPGYGYDVPIFPAVYRYKCLKRRVAIDVICKDKTVIRLRVNPENISPRGRQP